MIGEILREILKGIGLVIIGILLISGLVFFSCINDIPSQIEYYENGIKVDAIKYHNEIYLKKGE